MQGDSQESPAAWPFAQGYHKQFARNEALTAAADQFKQQTALLKVSMLQDSVRRYEDELFAIEFKIANGEATALDCAQNTRIERQLEDLRSQISALR